MASSPRAHLMLCTFLILNSHLIPLSISLSLSFPLTSISLSSINQQLLSSQATTNNHHPYNYRSSFKYSMALIVTLPIGTPPQSQQMVLDTGSQLSWIQCRNNPTSSFDPSLSSSFSLLPCTHPLCKPRKPDFTLPTSCDHNRLCHYSYFYADGTLAEGNLVRERFTFSKAHITPPLILGCASYSSDNQGILGMNRGRMSFASQSRLGKFSYCVPSRNSTGIFYLGDNPNSPTFKYVNILIFPKPQQMPNLDPYAYTLPMVGIRLAGKRLNISVSVFRPDTGGSGQTMIDSGSEFSYLVDEAYNKVKEEIGKVVGRKMKKGYVYEGGLEMCFGGGKMEEIGRLIGDLVFEFEKGVEIVVKKERVLSYVGGGIHCLGISRSGLLGAASNIIGNVHQQDLWVEYDVDKRRVGFGQALCRSSRLG
ncbi:aspartic proteinase PCS1-like [Impatiens glandulifera]|uniref:aspartic proteinase PCS1-like n=1 Tax=Impatiens glandulifera TaxID=253017 RepID=UPI001FB0A80C|nr:aspartic proteinase PCS1-like [Impatiens glandulifera]